MSTRTGHLLARNMIRKKWTVNLSVLLFFFFKLTAVVRTERENREFFFTVVANEIFELFIHCGKAEKLKTNRENFFLNPLAKKNVVEHSPDG